MMRFCAFMAIILGLVLYLTLGAVVFCALEAQQEEDKYTELQKMRRNFLLNFTCISPDNLQDFIEKVMDAVSAGVDPTTSDPFVPQWNLPSAFFFSGTIITTIGFGNTSPKTEGGQLFCIFYALVGIPLFGIALAGVGDHLGTGLRESVAEIETLFLKWRVSPTVVRLISAFLSLLLGCVIFVAVPIFVFQEVEKWTLLESAYFVVITLTTVGFGDYVTGSGKNGNSFWYKPLVWFWILLGLAYFASVLTMIGNWLRVLTKKTKAEMQGLRAHASDWTHNIQNRSMDFGITGVIDDPFQRRRRRRRHGHRSHGHNASGAGDAEGREEPRDRHTGSGSYTSSSYTSDSGSGSETDYRATRSEQVPEEQTAEIPPDPHQSQPLDYFGENLTFIDESPDAQSSELHLEPFRDTVQANCVQSRHAKRRRHRKPVPPRSPKVSRSNHAKKKHNGIPKPVPGLPPA